jgi:HEAT repeat protein
VKKTKQASSKSLKKEKLALINSSLLKIRTTKNKDKRFKIIQSLSRIKSPWASQVLLESLEEPSEAIRDFIIRELGSREGLRLTLVRKGLSNHVWYVKSATLKILGLLKKKNAFVHILPMLEEPNIEVRRNAVEALGEIGGEKSLEILADLINDDNPFIRASAKKALQKASNLKIN